jgi:excisionase family DNA binding protein
MINRQGLQYDELLTPAEVAAMFCVAPKTVARWAKEGKLPHIRTIGGHRRYPKHSATKFLEGHEPQKLYAVGVVAKLFRVTPKTVSRWTKEGRLKYITTPGGARRYPSTEVSAFLG